MFFSASEEHVTLIGHEEQLEKQQSPKSNDFHSISIQRENSEAISGLIDIDRRYLEMDTFIICNPNAMNYQ